MQVRAMSLGLISARKAEDDEEERTYRENFG
jgi:hypothetical protein